jgi:hypothetical protein
VPAALDLQDEAFFAADQDTELTIQLLESSFVGVAIRAPDRVDTAKRDSLPLLIASRFDGARDWDLPFGDNGVLVGIDLPAQEVRVTPAFQSAKTAMDTEPEPRPSPEELAGFGAQVVRVDARALLDVPWTPGCWVFALIYYDWMSNPVRVSLEGAGDRGAAGGRSPEGCVAPQSVGESQVSFRLAMGGGGSVRMEAEYSLSGATVSGASQTARSGQETLQATLLIVSPGRPAPARFNWQLPIERGMHGDPVRGRAEREISLERTPDDAAVAYLILGGGVFGPQPVTGSSDRPIDRRATTGRVSEGREAGRR